MLRCLHVCCDCPFGCHTYRPCEWEKALQISWQRQGLTHTSYLPSALLLKITAGLIIFSRYCASGKSRSTKSRSMLLYFRRNNSCVLATCHAHPYPSFVDPFLCLLLSPSPCLVPAPCACPSPDAGPYLAGRQHACALPCPFPASQPPSHDDGSLSPAAQHPSCPRAPPCGAVLLPCPWSQAWSDCPWRSDAGCPFRAHGQPPWCLAQKEPLIEIATCASSQGFRGTTDQHCCSCYAGILLLHGLTIIAGATDSAPDPPHT